MTGSGGDDDPIPNYCAGCGVYGHSDEDSHPMKDDAPKCDAGRRGDFEGRWRVPCDYEFVDGDMVHHLGWPGIRDDEEPLRFCDQHMRQLIAAGLVTDAYLSEDEYARLREENEAVKDDAPTPDEIPTKRRQIRGALDRWIAEWLARDDLTLMQRNRLMIERARRRKPVIGVTALIVGREGMTPQQRARVKEMGPSVAAMVPDDDARELIREASGMIAAPKSRTPAGPVWDAVRYAKHRGVPVRVVLPNGEEGS